MVALSGREYDSVDNSHEDYNDNPDNRETFTEIEMRMRTDGRR